jgi:hypothetical protein
VFRAPTDARTQARKPSRGKGWERTIARRPFLISFSFSSSRLPLEKPAPTQPLLSERCRADAAYNLRRF